MFEKRRFSRPQHRNAQKRCRDGSEGEHRQHVRHHGFFFGRDGTMAVAVVPVIAVAVFGLVLRKGPVNVIKYDRHI